MEKYILAIDEGTTNAKALLINQKGEIVFKDSRPLNVFHPQADWSEQDPEAIWQAVVSLLRSCIEYSYPDAIAAIAISNQRESVMMWERDSGKAITPLISWQCRRSVPFCQALKESNIEPLLIEKTGLMIDPLFPAAKINWLLNDLPNGFEKAQTGFYCAGTVDAWLLWKLTGTKEFATDSSNASRTQLFNLNTQEWDKALLDVFEVPASLLPKVNPSSCIHGKTHNIDGFPDGVPIASMIGDSHAALYGHKGFEEGAVKATFGTGSSLMSVTNISKQPEHGLTKTIAWADKYGVCQALEGNITHSGSALDWVRSVIGDIPESALNNIEAHALTNGGVYFVPALSGLGAPHWQTDVKATFSGIDISTTKYQLLRAGLESIAYQVKDILDAIEKDTKQQVTKVMVDGGPTANAWLMQFLSNLIQKPVIRNLDAEVSAIGAAFLAGQSIGWWETHESLKALDHPVQSFYPKVGSDLVEKWYEGWKDALARTLI
ncbi:putative Glycerol kinase [Vibrio nigripulchritudo SFn27]|uniref:Putative Glycerol kinase n=1 Tax=Vibrio nigripulchritudo TaxID=28173 RepID=U4KDG6_9VIBR|nr:FGGY family carbohydrate kinase [Vibrio nigripulchritudo]CCN81831.1 putative Glycerol kinase [Vibrio nigripulchritudo BLFn1]CCN88299.1 putative Glycerol kinase [Vibrio nigripulchritudo SFn27]CCN95289.1 putative Glycerol kinase [Vibrio nigripulchritudo ENn2]CCO41286.1 putative Glycerol kinase [Vibrio nigripulchritudo SFn135]CCO53985.1 putative Glycerol kinase [Vibrio nigripulchritudo Wn13]